MKKTIVLMLLLALSGSVFAEGLTPGKPADITPELKTGDQRWPAVSYGGGVYFAVWQEGEMLAGVEDTNIMAARVSPGGKPLDPKGISVCAAKGFQGYPAVAFDGKDFLVAWQDFRNGKDWDLYAARVTVEGKVLDADGFAVAAVPGNQVYPTVASDGKKALVAWSDVREGFKPELYNLYGTFVTSGKPAAAGGKELSKGGASLLDPKVIWDGSGYGIAASHGKPGWSPGVPYAIRVSSDGAASAWDIPGFLPWTFSFASDPASGRSCLWSNDRAGHGSYHANYLVGILDGKDPGKNVRRAVAGLQDVYAPRNDMWCAVSFNGKHFVTVIEQSDLFKTASNKHYPNPSVSLTANRVDPATAETKDTPSCPMPGKRTDMRKVVGSVEYKKAFKEGPHGVTVASEKGIQLRQPAIASAGDGKSLVVYSRHGGVNDFKIYAVTLTE